MTAVAAQGPKILLVDGYNTKLQNFKVSPGTSDFTFQSENWWLKP